MEGLLSTGPTLSSLKLKQDNYSTFKSQLDCVPSSSSKQIPFMGLSVHNLFKILLLQELVNRFSLGHFALIWHN